MRRLPARLVRLGGLVLLSGGLALVLLELGAFGLVRSGALAVPAPHRGETGFWWHQHPRFGAWHHPDMEGPHTGACYDVRYRTNSVGARDQERPLRAAGPRVVVLGDSFLEGYGLPARSRLSNQLEKRTGVPHLNFAMASFGLYQQLLVYRELASRFDHTAVIASFLPVNDFADGDLALARHMPVAEYTYRPYLVKTHAGWERRDHRESPVRRLLRLHSYAWNAVYWSFFAGGGSPLADHGSWFERFPESGVEQTVHLMQELAAAAGERPVVLLLIPALEDLERQARAGPSPLAARLAGPAREAGIVLLDLSGPMAERGRDWSAYFLPCDFHWSHYGNRVAAEIVESALAGLVYPLVD
ncbi:MAG: alginate O-acetyltransferase AlgX-related protein [Myxococcota bacterium]